jgi:hypothetical protein
MTFAPRFIAIVPYGLAWCAVLGIALVQLPWPLLLAAILIQSINTFSVRLVPVRVTIKAEHVDCSYPLARKRVSFALSDSERFVHAHPIPCFRFADFLIIRHKDRRVGLWRFGTTDFDALCRELHAKKA